MSTVGPDNGLFEDFITQTVNGKQETWGFIAHVQTEEQKHFINTYFQALGIFLNNGDAKISQIKINIQINLTL